MQTLGVVVYVQTEHEHKLLNGRFPDRCRLSGHGLPATIRTKLRSRFSPSQASDRPIDLLFLGRPTAQKGWDRFLKIASITNLHCVAIVPTPPKSHANITVHHSPSDAEVQRLLSVSKLALIPANYESFGIAQLEALIAGCAVPILGRWPLWDGCSALQWQHLPLEDLAERCAYLCSHAEQRSQLVEEQLLFLQHHSAIDTPIPSRLVRPGIPGIEVITMMPCSDSHYTLS